MVTTLMFSFLFLLIVPFMAIISGFNIPPTSLHQNKYHSQTASRIHTLFTYSESASTTRIYQQQQRQQQENDDISPEHFDLSLVASLNARREALGKGIGKRYVVRTMLGFLNVHSTYMDGPYATNNIVHSLSEGTIITSTESNTTIGFPPEVWIHHDRGGWSVAEFRGFKWLEEIRE